MKKKNNNIATLKKDIAIAKKKAEDTFKTTKAKLLKAEKDVKKYIEKNPKRAAAIAAGIGAAVGAGITAALMKTRKK